MFGRLSKNRLVIGVLCFLIIFTCGIESVQAYNMSADHEVNVKDVDIEATKLKLWKTIRSWGFSEAATAGIMGNIEGECSYNYTKIQDGISWGSFSKGSCGIGLVQWTSSNRQQGLFDLCDVRGTQWTDLDTQLEWLKKEIDGETGETTWWKYADNCKSYEDFKNLNNVYVATDVFCWGFERPDSASADVERRRSSAKYAFEQFTGTSVEGDEAGGGTLNNSSKGTNAQLIVKEWDLEGMPAQSGLLNDCDKVMLPNSDSLEDSEKYSVSIVKDNIMLNREVNLYDMIRVSIVFLGLLLIVYAVILLVAYIFDSTNNIFEISLLKIMTFGMVRYTADEENKNKKGYMSKGKLIKVCVLCMVAGFFIASGGVFAWVLDLYYKITEVL